jgi:hypothetical protein
MNKGKPNEDAIFLEIKVCILSPSTELHQLVNAKFKEQAVEEGIKMSAMVL